MPDRDFTLGLNVYLTLSHAINSQGQGHALGVKRGKNKAQSQLLWRNIYQFRHACVS